MRNLRHRRNLGLSLLEVLIAMTLSLMVMSGVISVLMLSKSNFITENAMASLQESARFAIKYITDEVHLAGYSSCRRSPLKEANIINNSQNKWYLKGLGIEGYEQFDSESGRSTYPTEFNADTKLHTDAIVIRRGEQSGLQIVTSYSDDSTTIPLNKGHDIQKGAIIIIASPDCQQLGIFQMSNPENSAKNATTLSHTIGGTFPGNCRQELMGNFNCNEGSTLAQSYPPGSSVMRLKSMAFYIGESAFNDSPALFQELLTVSGLAATTTTQELVQGVENMQIIYGLDNIGNDGAVDTYLEANAAAMDWHNVLSVRLSLRLRSLHPVYNKAQAYKNFMGIDDTGGSDRFLRQQVTTTIKLRNR